METKEQQTARGQCGAGSDGVERWAVTLEEASRRSGQYICHRCSVEIVPRPPDYICPRREFDQEHRKRFCPLAAPTDQSRPPLENLDQHLCKRPQGSGQFALGIFDYGMEIPTFPPGAQADDGQDPESRREGEHQFRPRAAPGSPAPASPRRPPSPAWVLGDQASGADGLDAITQLLHQFESTGPPPADKEKIQALPTVPVTEEHVRSRLQCPVCKDDYALGEVVRQLPCSHLFHGGCVVPWLEQRDSCPVCRNSLTGQNTATNPLGLAGMSFSSESSSFSSSSPSN
ncbi:hypothetical protein P7K49_011369 [Saguinus oedipus]|uniref:RING-type domain-containing protein n=1 Tax=Saguinus oedipus TaxID=9490 RepID=A0ABQ9VSU3_SAGOE|nr:hypothetical protein P7K49_011369 [Saguinus oedipus]